MSREEKYFNAPVQLLQGFMNDSFKCLDNFFDYSVYYYVLTHKDTNLDFERAYKMAEKDLKIRCGRIEDTYKNGVKLYSKIPEGSVKVGINKSLFFDFYENHNKKTNFEKACFLAFTAIKSIMQSKPYCKITNLYLWSRMDGKEKAVNDISELSPEIQFYANEYQTKKIKEELRNNWNLKYYGRYVRGCYYSFSLSLDKLIFEAEKRRKKNINAINKEKDKEAYSKAMQMLELCKGSSRPIIRSYTNYNKTNQATKSGVNRYNVNELWHRPDRPEYVE